MAAGRCGGGDGGIGGGLKGAYLLYSLSEGLFECRNADLASDGQFDALRRLAFGDDNAVLQLVDLGAGGFVHELPELLLGHVDPFYDC